MKEACDMEFLGYHRSDGQVGVRNHVLVLPGGLVAARICDFVAGTATVLAPAFDAAGFSARDRMTISRTLTGLGSNPNVAAVIIIGEAPHEGYPELQTEWLADKISSTGKPVEIVMISSASNGKGVEALSGLGNNDLSEKGQRSPSTPHLDFRYRPRTKTNA
jgi:altronate dehydratase